MAGGEREGGRAAAVRGDARGPRQDVQTGRDPGRSLSRADDGAVGLVSVPQRRPRRLGGRAPRPPVLSAFAVGGFALDRSGMIGSSKKFSRPPPMWIVVLPP